MFCPKVIQFRYIPASHSTPPASLYHLSANFPEATKLVQISMQSLCKQADEHRFMAGAV